MKPQGIKIIDVTAVITHHRRGQEIEILQCFGKHSRKASTNDIQLIQFSQLRNANSSLDLSKAVVLAKHVLQIQPLTLIQVANNNFPMISNQLEVFGHLGIVS